MVRHRRGYATASIAKRAIGLWACVLFSALPASAKTLYVNGSTGNDSVSYAANGPSAPWRSIGRALWGSTNRSAPNPAEAARAGDVVDIACGVYETTGTNTNGFTGIALSPVNNGMASQPIRIQSSGNQFACIQVRFTSGYGSVIGTHNKSYVQWSGFDLNEVNTPWSSTVGHQSAQVWISGDEAGTTAVGNLVENTRLRGTRTSARDGDNYTVLRLHGTSDTTVRNVHISDVGMTDENSGCILWYFTKNFTLEHSLLERCGSGIYMKGDSQERPSFYRIRYNRFINNHKGIQAFTNANATPTTPGIIAQNIFSGGEYGVKILNWDINSPANPNDLKFLNNVFTGHSSWPIEIRGELHPEAHLLFQNNIFLTNGGTVFGSAGGSSTASLEQVRLLAKHNVYQNVSVSDFCSIGGAAVSFSTWQNTYGQDTAPPPGMMTSASPFADSDFHLVANTPVRTQGRAAFGIGGADGTVIPAGPYITGNEVIGLTGGSVTDPTPTAPAAPTGLRIIR